MWKITKGTQLPEPWEKYWSIFPEKQFFSLKMSYLEDWLASWKMHTFKMNLRVICYERNSETFISDDRAKKLPNLDETEVRPELCGEPLTKYSTWQY